MLIILVVSSDVVLLIPVFDDSLDKNVYFVINPKHTNRSSGLK